MGYVRELSVDLGPRESATDQEREAAEYLIFRFEEFGYETSLQPFALESLSRELSSLVLQEPNSKQVDVIPLTGSATGKVSGVLELAGLATTDDIREVKLDGKIALVERGLIAFREKVDRMAEAGATGVVVFNNVPGNFQGALPSASRIPAVAISREDGKKLKELLISREVRATITVEMKSRPSQNVIAEKTGSGQGVVVLGAHYDTVASTPGANDNASGTAVLLTVAQQLAGKSFPFTLRFIAFGSEELGLRGSRHYVASLSQEQQRQIIVMLNLDALGTGDSVVVLGDGGLIDEVVQLGAGVGISVDRSRGIGGSSSDHASFRQVGIPVVMFSSQDFSRIHSAGDTLEHIDPQLLGDTVRLAVSLLESLDGSKDELR